MKVICCFLFLLFFLPENNLGSDNTGLKIMDFEELSPYLNMENDSIYVINFWATWCAPCRREMPEFIKLESAYKNEKLKIILVSLDFVSNIEKGLIPYIEEKKIQSEVIVLNDPDANSWIDKVDPNWSGSLPATIIYSSKSRFFIPNEVTYNLLEDYIDRLTSP